MRQLKASLLGLRVPLGSRDVHGGCYDAAMLLIAMNRPEVPPLSVSDRFRQQLPYFMTCAGEPGVPPLAAGEYWIRTEEARRWLEEGCVSVVSPLSAEAKAEIELTEEQEEFLDWLVRNGVEHIRGEAG